MCHSNVWKRVLFSGECDGFIVISTNLTKPLDLEMERMMGKYVRKLEDEKDKRTVRRLGTLRAYVGEHAALTTYRAIVSMEPYCCLDNQALGKRESSFPLQLRFL